jgi:hypothetical protein
MLRDDLAKKICQVYRLFRTKNAKLKTDEKASYVGINGLFEQK